MLLVTSWFKAKAHPEYNELASNLTEYMVSLEKIFPQI